MIPAFETQQYRPEMPYDKEELKKYVDTGQVQIFRFVHGSNNFTTHIVSIGLVEDYPTRYTILSEISGNSCSKSHCENA